MWNDPILFLRPNILSLAEQSLKPVFLEDISVIFLVKTSQRLRFEEHVSFD